MTLFDAETVDSLLKVYLVANTPSYLYKHFRGHPTVQLAAHTSTVDQLESSFSDALADSVPDMIALVKAYASLLAATLKPYGEAKTFLKNVPLEKLNWGPELKAIFEARTTPSQLFDMGGHFILPSAVHSGTNSIRPVRKLRLLGE